MSFLCNGETPIGGDALADSLKKIRENGSKTSVEVRVFIATGQAAENISISQEKKARAKVFDKFLKTYESKNIDISIIEEDRNNVFIPSLLSGLSIDFISNVERCSLKFRTLMQEFLLESIVNNQPFPGIDIQKKRFTSKYQMRWSL